MEEDLQKQIEDFLNDRMPDAERQQFAERINREPRLQAELEMLHLEREMAGIVFRDRLGAKAAAWEQEYQHSRQIPVPSAGRLRKWWLLGFVLLIPIGFFLYSYFSSDPIPPISSEPVEQKTNEEESGGTVKEDTISTPTTSPANPLAAIQTELSTAAGQSRYLTQTVARHKGILQSAGHTDWEQELLAGKYQQAWQLLQPIVSDPENTPEYLPLPFYFAALLQLYWDRSLEGINAADELQQIDYEALRSQAPDLQEAELIRHRIVALYAVGRNEEARQMIETHKALLLK
ncbi:MAG: hypothetical protein KF852_04700 [Saprospiraceae bacterium]|nr:hypothetical protein [Saprospiraceae bacterium]